MPFPNPIEVPTPIAPTVYNGTMDASTFEVAEPGVANTTRIIRTTQNWGVKYDWEMTGALCIFLNADFHLRIYLESMGPGPEFALPAADEIVNSLSGALAFPAGVPTRSYSHSINVPAGTVPAGTYKIVALLQLTSTGAVPPNPKYPVAGLVELQVVDFFAAP